MPVAASLLSLTLPVLAAAAGLLPTAAAARPVARAAATSRDVATHEATPMRCAARDVPVGPSAAAASSWRAFAKLCWRGARAGKTVHVTVAGTTYTHAYWDFAVQPDRYSYARALTAAGDAVLVYDRIGVGRSTKAPAHEITIPAHAHVLHQLVDAVRRGRFGGTRHDRVVTVGHSQGSLIAMSEAATYRDVDGVVLTGILHTVTAGPGTAMFVASVLRPAQTDPRFADRPAGYLTTIDALRTASLYHLPTADPAVIAHDEATKDTTVAAELATAPPALAQTGDIHVPVLTVIGEHDGLLCGVPCGSAASPTRFEGGFYPPDACHELFVLPDAGHDVNLHPNAPDAFRAIGAWSGRRVGTSGRPPSAPCT